MNKRLVRLTCGKIVDLKEVYILDCEELLFELDKRYYRKNSIPSKRAILELQEEIKSKKVKSNE